MAQKTQIICDRCGKGYKNHCIVIETWARREAEKKKDNPSTAKAVPLPLGKGGTGQRSKFNNYDDTNKPDYSNFGEQILKEMLEE